MAFSVDDLLLRHFGLRENPFGVTPDPRFLFMTHTHREALASLVNGIECGFGFQVLVAQPGMGKTTLLFDLLERFNTSRTAFLFQQQDDPRDFLQSLLLELKSESAETSKAKLYGQLNDLLSEVAQTHERVIVVVDEAQNLEDSLLETLRQLSNFETSRAKLLHIVLAGQPQLAKTLARPEQQQLRQRVSSIARLSPLGLDETRTYLSHRLNIAGYRGPGIFTTTAVQSVWSNAHGIPRNMNTLCFNAMLLAYAQSARRVDEHAVMEATQDLDLDFVLADVAGSERPSVSRTELNPSFGTGLEAQKATRNLKPSVRGLSGANGRLQPSSEPGGNPTSIAVGERAPSSPSVTPPTVSAREMTSRDLAVGDPKSPNLKSSDLKSQDLKSGDLQTEEKKPREQQPVVVPVRAQQRSQPSVARATPAPRTNAASKALWVSLAAAALGAGVLFGHGLGTRGQSQVEEHPEATTAQSRTQDPQPLLDAPIASPRNSRPSSFAVDDGPEVIVRTFPHSALNQPDGAAQQNVKAVFFDADSAVVSKRYEITLQRISELLAASPESTAIIEGHTDNSGEEPYNLELSTRRAEAVKDVLESEHNISPTRLSTVGAGSSSPIESNSTSSGRAYNRRAEVRIMQPASEARANP